MKGARKEKKRNVKAELELSQANSLSLCSSPFVGSTV
jgi:hypothetical protein